MRIKAFLATAVVAAAGVAVLTAPAASAATSPSSYTARLAYLVNQAREQNGVRALTVTSGTSEVAAGWSAHLASAQALSHNPNLASQLESHGSPNWTTYGENVGQGTSSNADALFTAYMNSPEHRANILDPSYRYLGIATVFTGSYSWNTMDFVDQYGSTTSAPRTSTAPTHHTTTTTVRHTTSTAPVHHSTTVRRPVVKHVAARHVATKPAAAPIATMSAPAQPAPVASIFAAGHGATLPSVSSTDGARTLAVIVAAALVVLLSAAWVGARRAGV